MENHEYAKGTPYSNRALRTIVVWPKQEGLTFCPDSEVMLSCFEETFLQEFTDKRFAIILSRLTESQILEIKKTLGYVKGPSAQSCHDNARSAIFCLLGEH